MALTNDINSWIAGPCGTTTYIYLIGYSQGAQVVGDVCQSHLSSAAQARVQGVALIADPRFYPSEPSGVDVGTYQHLTGVDLLSPARVVPNSEASIVRSYCAILDPVCNFSEHNAIGCLLDKSIGATCVHFDYFDQTLTGDTTYTVAAGDFLLSRWRAKGPAIVSVGSRTSVLLYGNGGDSTDAGGTANLQGTLTGAGYAVSLASTLPSDLSSYGQVWEYGVRDITTTAEEQELISYVKDGGSLFLSGEWSGCCGTPTNDAAAAYIFDSLVITVGGLQLGPDNDSGSGTDDVNTSAIDGLATTPNRLSTFRGADVGSISPTNIDQSHFVFEDAAGDGTVGAWDPQDVTGGGRLVIVMDTNWAASAYEDSSTFASIVQNLAYFLSGGVTPPQSSSS